MSMFYNGKIQSIPHKFRTDDERHIVIRPLAYTQEDTIARFATEQPFPIIPCNLCGSQINLARVKTKKLIAQLAQENPKIPSNLLSSLANVRKSQLMDHHLWDFKSLAIEPIQDPEKID